MTRQRFRQILLAYVLSIPLHFAAAYGVFGGDISPLLAAAYDSEPSPFSSQPPRLILLELAVLLGIFVMNIVGLYRFRHWARVMSVGMTVLSVPFGIFMGPTLHRGFEAGLLDLSMTLWGAILALAFYSPVSAEFARGAHPAV